MYRYFREVLASSPGLENDLPDAAMRRRVHKAAELEFNAYLQSLWDEEGTVDTWRSRCFYEMAEGKRRLESLRVLQFEMLSDDLAHALGTTEVSLPYLNATHDHPSTCRFDARSIEIVQASYDWVFSAGWYALEDYPRAGMMPPPGNSQRPLTENRQSNKFVGPLARPR